MPPHDAAHCTHPPVYRMAGIASIWLTRVELPQDLPGDTAEGVAGGRRDPLALFMENMALESHLFMGDWSTFRRLAALCDGPTPLLRCRSGLPFRYPPRDKIDIEAFRGQRFVLSASGQEVFDGTADAAALNPVDHWLGGVHLHGDAPLWRWDEEQGQLTLKTA